MNSIFGDNFDLSEERPPSQLYSDHLPYGITFAQAVALKHSMEVYRKYLEDALFQGGKKQAEELNVNS